MKYIIFLLMLIIFLIPSSVYATTENVTWVATDNFTASVAANVSFPDDIPLTALTSEIDDLSDTIGAGIYTLFLIQLMITMAVLAFWKKDPILHLIAGLLWVFYGFDIWYSSHVISVGIVVSGIIVIVRGFVKRGKEA